MDKIETPLELYSNVVEIDVAEFLSTPDDLRLAYHACVSLLSLRDWIFENYRGTAWTCLGHSQPIFRSKSNFQSTLEQLLDDFRIVTDVANASKHLFLDVNRRRTQAQGAANVQIQSTTTYIGGALLGSFVLNATPLNQPPTPVIADCVIIDDGGQIYDVKMSVERTNRIWNNLLGENGW